ncbi:hypothetical protein FOA52_008621 [Chlamydomonas sp. UWO 241]|nr:hypothetical protein FOA52_008621 [Chlamydomonas sp. UWO 241]
MCIAFWGFGEAFDLPELAFLLAFGRDEYLARPTSPAHFWPDQPTLLAGRDLQAGGTWLGVTTTGRLAFLTNLREADSRPDDSPSGSEGQSSSQQANSSAAERRHETRGRLTTDFLLGSSTPEKFAAGLDRRAYHGFNLVVADLVAGQVAYTAGGEHAERAPGGPVKLEKSRCYGLSNGLLGRPEQWSPKRD